MANEAEDIAKKNDPKQTNWACEWTARSPVTDRARLTVSPSPADGQQSHASQMHSTYSDDFIDESGGSSVRAPTPRQRLLPRP